MKMAARKKAARKKAARKSAARKKATRKSAARKKAARDKMRSPSSQGDKAGHVGRINHDVWFNTHPHAKEFVEIWMGMVANGESSWNAARVYRELVEEYDFPFTDPSGFHRWAHRNYPKEFRLAIHGE
jgi:hypothetical protein